MNGKGGALCSVEGSLGHRPVGAGPQVLQPYLPVLGRTRLGLWQPDAGSLRRCSHVPVFRWAHPGWVSVGTVGSEHLSPSRVTGDGETSKYPLKQHPPMLLGRVHRAGMIGPLMLRSRSVQPAHTRATREVCSLRRPCLAGVKQHHRHRNPGPHRCRGTARVWLPHLRGRRRLARPSG